MRPRGRRDRADARAVGVDKRCGPRAVPRFGLGVLRVPRCDGAAARRGRDRRRRGRRRHGRSRLCRRHLPCRPRDHRAAPHRGAARRGLARLRRRADVPPLGAVTRRPTGAASPAPRHHARVRRSHRRPRAVDRRQRASRSEPAGAHDRAAGPGGPALLLHRFRAAAVAARILASARGGTFPRGVQRPGAVLAGPSAARRSCGGVGGATGRRRRCRDRHQRRRSACCAWVGPRRGVEARRGFGWFRPRDDEQRATGCDPRAARRPAQPGHHGGDLGAVDASLRRRRVAPPRAVRDRARAGARPRAARGAHATQRATSRPRIRRGHHVERAHAAHHVLEQGCRGALRMVEPRGDRARRGRAAPVRAARGQGGDPRGAAQPRSLGRRDHPDHQGRQPDQRGGEMGAAEGQRRLAGRGHRDRPRRDRGQGRRSGASRGARRCGGGVAGEERVPLAHEP